MVERGPRADGGQRADGDAEQDGDERGRERQARGGRQPLDDDLADGSLLAERLAEVAARQPPEPRRVLHGQRPIQRILTAQPLERRRIRALAHRGAGGIAERDGVEREDEDGDAEDDGDERDDARHDRAQQSHAHGRAECSKLTS
jgi:hypothetical protein